MPRGTFTLSEEQAIKLRTFAHKLGAADVQEFLDSQEAILERVFGSAKEAEMARRTAEEMARQRQEDLLNITHQIQGALIAVIGALSAIDKRLLPSRDRTYLVHAQNIVEDAIAITYGSFISMARESGYEPAFKATRINAPKAVQELFGRVRMTNSREDLNFRLMVDPLFPEIEMDRDVFTSMMFSLVHNAMKYSDANSTVTVKFLSPQEGRDGALKITTIGEPIDVDEKDIIFEKFRRGKAVAHGRHHLGAGLGLWVARELMRAVGGDITLELSPHDPRLTTFVVRIPRTLVGNRRDE